MDIAPNSHHTSLPHNDGIDDPTAQQKVVGLLQGGDPLGRQRQTLLLR